MGTVFSFDIPAAAAPVLPAVVSWLHWADATFSTYRDDSDVSRFGRGELTLAQCAPELAEVIAGCAVIRDRSNGYFTDRPGGRFDPSGLVKGWAIEHAAAMLSAAGWTSHSVNGAGDLQCTGEPEPGQPWRIGVAHPLCPAALAVIVTGRDIAVATSGTAERGAHIINAAHRPARRGPGQRHGRRPAGGHRRRLRDRRVRDGPRGPGLGGEPGRLRGARHPPRRRGLADQRLRRVHGAPLRQAARRPVPRWEGGPPPDAAVSAVSRFAHGDQRGSRRRRCLESPYGNARTAARPAAHVPVRPGPGLPVAGPGIADPDRRRAARSRRGHRGRARHPRPPARGPGPDHPHPLPRGPRRVGRRHRRRQRCGRAGAPLRRARHPR